MPRHPERSAAARAMPESVFARLWPRLEGHRGEVFPFHLGDVHLPPPVPPPGPEPGWFPYGAPAGDAELIAALSDDLRARNGLEGAVQITCGATHALACATRALIDPGDEVLLLSPHWPLIHAQVLACLGRPVEVEAADLAAAVGPRTACIYLATPGNPDGRVLGRAALAAIAEVARAADLWVLADEVYQDFVYDGREHVSIGALPGMAERTLTAFSFSKSHGLAGLRVGHLVGPPPVIDAVRKLSNHSVFNVPRAAQRAALAALGADLAPARALYQAARDLVQARLSVPFVPAEGGAYVFCDLRGQGDDALERLAARGVLLAPGEAFGEAYRGWARLCFTATDRERLERGLAVMADELGPPP